MSGSNINFQAGKVTIRTYVINVLGTCQSKAWCLARGRTPSDDSDDQQSVMSSPSLLPPISSSHNLIGMKDGQSSTSCMITNSQEQLWAGDPEAISSIRRCKKPSVTQRLDFGEHKWTRSRSLKENLSTRQAKSLSRSHSLREHEHLTSSRLSALKYRDKPEFE